MSEYIYHPCREEVLQKKLRSKLRKLCLAVDHRGQRACTEIRTEEHCEEARERRTKQREAGRAGMLSEDEPYFVSGSESRSHWANICTGGWAIQRKEERTSLHFGK